MTAPFTIAFIGTGLMGAPMASRLLGAGHRLRIWNRTPAKTEQLAREGASVAESPASAVAGAAIVITMLTDGPTVTDVLFKQDVARATSRGATIIDMSSIPPALAREHAIHLRDQGIWHLDAPVSGGTQGAREGTLAIMVGGPAAIYESMQPALAPMGRATLVGPSGSGQLAKLANQAVVALIIGAVSEALLLAAAGGADPRKVRDALTGGFADSKVLHVHGQRMLAREWIPGGPLRTHLKDLRTILAEAAPLGLSLPLTEEAAQLFESALTAGFGDHDQSALLLELERRNPGKRVGDTPDQSPVHL